MSDTIKLTIDLTAYRHSMTKLIAALTQRRGLMTALAGTMLDAVETNFAQEGRPKWMGWSPAYAKKRKGGKILQKSGRLASSITSRVTNDKAVVGSNLRYARIHNQGGEIKHPARTQDLYFKVSEPNMKQWKAMKTGFEFSSKRNSNFVQSATIGAYTVNMPARPYLQLIDSDIKELQETAANYFLRVIDGDS